MRHPFFDLRRPHRDRPPRRSGEAPENTLPAFARALAQGAVILETDVHATRDGVVVVLPRRRASSARPTATEPIAELDFAELRAPRRGPPLHAGRRPDLPVPRPGPARRRRLAEAFAGVARRALQRRDQARRRGRSSEGTVARGGRGGARRPHAAHRRRRRRDGAAAPAPRETGLAPASGAQHRRRDPLRARRARRARQPPPEPHGAPDPAGVRRPPARHAGAREPSPTRTTCRCTSGR